MGLLAHGGVDVIDWPPKLPDVKPILNVWDQIGNHILSYANAPNKFRESVCDRGLAKRVNCMARGPPAKQTPGD